MRKVNAILTAGIIILFLIHGIMGAFSLMEISPGGNSLMMMAGWAMIALIAVHTIIGIKLTADTVKAMKRSGAGYFKENKLFWVRRASGTAVTVFIIAHVVIFEGVKEGEVYRLTVFGALELTSQILLAVSIALHAVSNAKPMLISFGFRGFKEAGLDIALILSLLLILMGTGFIIYYIRWNVI